jgi:hypothetical protein
MLNPKVLLIAVCLRALPLSTASTIVTIDDFEGRSTGLSGIFGGMRENDVWLGSGPCCNTCDHMSYQYTKVRQHQVRSESYV